MKDKKYKQAHLKLVILFLILFLFNCKNEDYKYSNFEILSRGIDNKVEIINNKKDVKKLNYIISTAKEIDYIKKPLFDYILVCKSENTSRVDTMFISNHYLITQGKCFKTQESIYENVNIKWENLPTVTLK